MRRIMGTWVLAAILLFSLAVSCTSRIEHTTEARKAPKKDWGADILATVVDLENKVEIRTKGSEEWKPLDLGAKINEGTAIRTLDKAYCILLLSDESTIKLGMNSLLEVNTLKEKMKNFSLNKGRVWSNVNKAVGKKSNFDIRAPHTIAAVRGTVFEMETDGETDTLSVFEGLVNFSSGEQMEMVTEHMHIKGDKTGLLGKPVTFSVNDANQWQKWNLDVDRELAALKQEGSAVAMNNETMKSQPAQSQPRVNLERDGKGGSDSEPGMPALEDSAEENDEVSPTPALKAEKKDIGEQIRKITKKHKNPFAK